MKISYGITVHNEHEEIERLLKDIEKLEKKVFNMNGGND